MSDRNYKIRIAIFEWLAEQVTIYSEVLPRSVLQRGFDFGGDRIPLISPQGIFRPRALTDAPLSITTAPMGPYDDGFSEDGLLLYRYRGEDSDHRDNAGLRIAMSKRIPLIYFHGVIPGKYLASWPVFVVGDDRGHLVFTVAVDEMASVRIPTNAASSQESNENLESVGRRAYITRLTRQRLHQQGFRERVLQAYREQCACCRLKHGELLDAAHIIPDADPMGIPSVNNGLALCKLHHAAFDSNFLGISPDFLIDIRPDILEEADGPMLRHGLQGLNGRTILLPHNTRLRPDSDALNKRYRLFRAAI